MTTTPVPLATVALRGRCPRCGRGPLFRGLLALRDRCESCGLDLQAMDTGDGPATAGIFILSAVTVIAAIIVEVKYEPALWVHVSSYNWSLSAASTQAMRTENPLEGSELFNTGDTSTVTVFSGAGAMLG